jgi:muconolactone delta-isomerase
VEFLVEFELKVSDGAGLPDLTLSEEIEVALAAEGLADQGHLLRLWFVGGGLEEDKLLGLYRTENVDELDAILENLPLHERVNVVITRLEFHPNDPHPPTDRDVLTP